MPPPSDPLGNLFGPYGSDLFPDDHIPRPETRWDGPDYTAGEFIKDRAETLGELALKYSTLTDMANDAADRLSKAGTPSWKSSGGTAFAAYLRGLRTDLGTLAKATNAAVLACHKRRPDMETAWRNALLAAKDCNDCRRRHETAQKALDHAVKEAKDAHLLHPGKNLDAARAKGRLELIEHEMSTHLGKARKAMKDNVDALKGLYTDLEQPDETLANLVLTAPPHPSSVTDPDERAFLQSLTDPVNKALAASGDTQRARDARSEFDQAMQDDPSGKKAQELLRKWTSDLSGPELDWVLAHVDETELATTLGTLNPVKDRDTYNALAKKASLDTLARLADTDPNHYWHPGTDGRYQWDSVGFYAGEVPTSDLGQVKQGELGDCYWLSSLAAVTKADPDYLKKHVKANENGTYTVTLFKDGKEIDVTVTPDVPYKTDATGNPTDPAFAGGNPNIYQLYEKALAQTYGEIAPDDGSGYTDAGDGGNPAKYLPIITGDSADSTKSDDVKLADVQRAVDDHKPVVVSTLSDDDADDKKKYDPDKPPHLLAGHAYYVESVDSSSDPPTVTLVNPWGADSKENGTVKMTWDEFQENTKRTTIGK